MRASASNSFSPKKRLRTNSEFQAVFRKCKKFSGRHFIFLVKKNALECPRVGVGISKKKIKTAVGRNKIKRIIRESFRKKQRQLPNLDIVVVVQKEADKIPSKILFETLDKKWQELMDFYGKSEKHHE